MEEAGQDAPEAFRELVQVLESQFGFVELALGENALHDRVDVVADAGGRGIGQRPAGGFHGVGQHDDGRFAGLGPGAGIAVVLNARVFAQFLGLGVKELDEPGAVVLPDDVHDLVTEMILGGKLRPLFGVGEEDEGAHGRGQLVMAVGAVELVFDVVVRVGELADVVIERGHLAQEAVCAHGLGSRLHHVGDDERMVVGAGDGDHEVLQERLFEVHELHEPKARGIAEGHFHNRAEREQDRQRDEGVEPHNTGKPQEGVTAPEAFQPAAAQGDDDLPDGQRDDADDHVLPALRPQDQPRVEHGRQEEEEEKGKFGLEHDAGEERNEQPDHAIAPRRENEGAQPRGPGHGEEMDGEGHILRLDDFANEEIRALGRHPEDEQQERDEEEVLAAQGGARLAARGHEQAEGQHEREHEGSGHGAGVDEPVLLLVEALKLELFLPGDALALIDDHFAFLDMVIDGLHRLRHGVPEGLRSLAVQGERGHDQRGEHDQHGPPPLRGQRGGGAQLLSEGGKHGGHVPDVPHFGAQGFRLVVHVPDDDPVLGGQGQTDAAHHAEAQLRLEPRQGRGEDVFLYGGQRPLSQQIAVDLRAEGFSERGAQGGGRGYGGGLSVDLFQHGKDLFPQRRDFGHAEIEDRGLEHGHLMTPGAGGLGVFHGQAAVGHHVAVGHLARHEDPELDGRLEPGQKGKRKKGGDEDKEPDAVVVLSEKGARQPGKLSDAKRRISRSHHRPVLFARPEDGVPHQPM